MSTRKEYAMDDGTTSPGATRWEKKTHGENMKKYLSAALLPLLAACAGPKVTPLDAEIMQYQVAANRQRNKQIKAREAKKAKEKGV